MENNKIKGTIYGLNSGILWGIDTVLIGIILGLSPLSNFSLIAPIVSTFFHDAFSSIWIFIYLIFKKQQNELLKVLKSKKIFFIIIASLFGGPVGMTGYVLSIKYIGSSYTATISSMYPAVGAFLAYILLKDKLRPRGIFGIILAISSTILLCISSGFEKRESMFLGFIFAITCTLGWALESVICAYIMKYNISAQIVLQIRQIISALSYLFIIIPIMGSYEQIFTVIKSDLILCLALTALIGTVSFLSYYSSINIIGPTRAMGLNISYSAWAIIFEVIIGNSNIDIKLLFICVLIIIGSILTCDDLGQFSLIFKKGLKNIVRK